MKNNQKSEEKKSLIKYKIKQTHHQSIIDQIERIWNQNLPIVILIHCMRIKEIRTKVTISMDIAITINDLGIMDNIIEEISKTMEILDNLMA